MDKDKKPKGPDRMMEVIVLVIMLMFIWLLVARVQQYLTYWGDGSIRSIWDSYWSYFVTHIWPILEIVAVILGALSLFGIYYNISKLKAINKEEKEIYGGSASDSTEEESEVLKNEKWENVQRLILSNNESDWRQAIIEADIMLGDLLTASGYHGDTIGDKLQSVEPSDFRTLNEAWEAHKIRNKIAHDGASFQLNEREAKQTINQFEIVFKEFQII
jgi:hypothetical protein